MTKSIDQAIQASVARALVWSLCTVLPLAIVAYAVAGEWQRFARVCMFGLFLLPLCLYCLRLLRREAVRQVLYVLSLSIWLGLGAQVVSAGTLANPVPPIMVAFAVTGLLAQERVLSWLLPLLTALTLGFVGVAAEQGLLTVRVPPSNLTMFFGCLLGMLYVAMLTLISNHHLQSMRQRELLQGEELRRLSGQLQLAIKAGGITCFNLDAASLSLTRTVDDEDLFGPASGDLQLKDLSVFSQLDRQRIVHAVDELQQQGSFPELTCQLQSGPGEGRWYRLYGTTAEQQSGQLICAMQDIHEQKQAELAKENFTAMVSHELRTPLTALLGALRLLQGLHVQSLTAEAQQLLQMALRGGERLAVLVNDVLDYFRLQAGRMPVTCQLQPVAPMLLSAVDAVQALLLERDLQLQLHGDMDAVAWLDSQRGGQVLINLLSNAIKFSPSGSRIALRVQPHAGRVRIALSDSGPGIDEEFSKRIFEPFSQANAGDTRDSNSTGLGLAISRQLMRQMEGELSYSSPPGEGATFYMDFLVQRVSSTRPD